MHVVAFGDAPNDKEMLEDVGYGVAMKNATEDVKAVADVVSSYTNDEDALAHFVTDEILKTIQIDWRRTRMSKWDDTYIQLCKDILAQGVEVENRTGINSIKLPSYHFQIDVSKEFPILTTKQLFIRQAALEMLWIYQQQSNDVRWLQDRNVHIWDKWEIDENGDWISEETGEVLKHFDPKYAHTIGTAYGYIVKNIN